MSSWGTAESFATLGISDLFNGKFNPLNLGKAGFAAMDKAMGTGHMIQSVGQAIDLVALLYGANAAGTAAAGYFGAAGAGAGGAGATGLGTDMAAGWTETGTGLATGSGSMTASVGTMGGAAAAGGAGYSILNTAAQTISAGSGLYSMFAAPKYNQGVLTPDNTEAQAYAQAESMAKRRGAASTILTSPMGITTPANTKKATLGD